MAIESFSPVSIQPRFTISFTNSLGAIKSEDWNHLLTDNNPFLRYEFLQALERNRCLGETFGWYPHHLIVHNENKMMVAASPLYIKTNSYGEFVFDWSWASAYEQSGFDYYPKFVTCIPYTPVTGARMLIAPELPSHHKIKIAEAMIHATIEAAKKLGMSSVHWLFCPEYERKFYKQSSLALRLGCQYHWHNRNYECFDHFLESLISRKRKEIKRERRLVKDQNIQIQRLYGSELDAVQWQQVHAFYTDTFFRKNSLPTLSLEFFKELGTTMGSQILLILAYEGTQLIACAINFQSNDTLYGRFWGCLKKFNCLHFEACYYQGIEHAIEHQLDAFQPGAQGEHKISRGFLPTKTWSAHWIADTRFRPAIQDFCQREERVMEYECKRLMSSSPYRNDQDTTF